MPTRDPHPSPKDQAAVLFWAALFFLGSADQVFNQPLFGFHVRWGQLLLAGAALASLRKLASIRPPEPVTAWLPFFLIYGLSSSLCGDPAHSFLKLGWAVFNIAGAGLVILTFRGENLTRGFRIAVWLNALSIWLASFYLQWLGLKMPFHIGQTAGIWGDHMLYRSSGFYYEPSYAGSALAFSVLLMFASGEKTGLSPAANGLILGAVVLTGSRTGILALSFGLLALLAFRVLYGNRDILRPVAKSSIFAAMFLCLFALHQGGRRYYSFLFNTLPLPQTIMDNIEAPGPTSETVRLGLMKRSTDQFLEKPLLGSGFVPSSNPSFGALRTDHTNTWLELLVECGLLGALAFALALGLNMREAWGRASPSLRIFLAAAWAAHFLVNLNFTQTFPRLDYWLLFFWSISLAPNLRGREGTRAFSTKTPSHQER